MPLKRMSVYQLNRPLAIADLNDLNAALGMRAERELGAAEFACDGFLPPLKSYRDKFCLVLGRNEHEWYDTDRVEDPVKAPFTNQVFPLEGNASLNDNSAGLMVVFYREEKVIVASDVRRRLDRKIQSIKDNEARDVYARERAELKQTITASLLPNAQSRVWSAPVIFCNNGLVLVGENGRKAEMILNELRAVLGTLPIRPVVWKNEIWASLTDLARMQLAGGYNEQGFRITHDFQMQELHEKPEIARMKNTDIANEHVQGWMAEGKVVTHADMAWKDKAILRLDYRGEFKKVRVDDAVVEGADADEEDVDNLAKASFGSALIEVSTIVDMLEAFSEMVGGIEPPKQLDGYDDSLQVLRNLAQSVDNSRAQESGDEE